MDWAWRYGMIIVMGVPAIVGGGIFWHFFERWTAVVIWEIVLMCLMSFVIVRGGKSSEAHH